MSEERTTVSKDILIFSDGTGQFGGLAPDQRLSNVYKLYRAMRPGPDSDIPPSRQVAFYDAGLGTSERRGNFLQRMRTVAGSAFGTGIGENVVDCYEAILKHWNPGDRVFLFGFSRGAYTARCVANTMNLCGVPTRSASGGPVPRHGPALREIAEEAVYRVYEHGSGRDRAEFEAEREEQARRFRARHGSAGRGLDGEEQGNVAPIFIGVFDTVAALGSVIARRILWTALGASLAASGLAWWLDAPMVAVLLLAPAVAVLLTLASTARRQFKSIRNGPSRRGLSWHFARWNLKHYDRFLDTNVGFARHALAIDENRERFPYVPWARSADVTRMEERAAADGRKLPWLRQVWFAGNHSDVGGSYPEDESRLSDIALDWMVSELTAIPEPPIISERMLRRHPDACGLQHDEVQWSRDSWFPRWWPGVLRFGWKARTRKINPGADLHPTVLERLSEPAVARYDQVAAYRPDNLRGHDLASRFYA